MLKEKWKVLALREKVLVICGILSIVSIITVLFEVIFIYCVSSTITLFIITVIYNLYKFIKNDNM